MRARGFTLLELTITMSILSVVGLLAFVAISGSAQSLAVARAKTDVQSDLRGVIQALSQELQLSAKSGNNALTPPLQDVQIAANPVAGSPIQIVFQVPTDGTARVWSTPITYRYLNEDANGNARLDPGEDTNNDGSLTRCLVRIQDGRQQVVGGANNLSDVRFVRNGGTITITLTATKTPTNQVRNPIRSTVSKRVYLVN